MALGATPEHPDDSSGTRPRRHDAARGRWPIRQRVQQPRGRSERQSTLLDSVAALRISTSSFEIGLKAVLLPFSRTRIVPESKSTSRQRSRLAELRDCVRAPDDHRNKMDLLDLWNATSAWRRRGARGGRRAGLRRCRRQCAVSRDARRDRPDHEREHTGKEAEAEVAVFAEAVENRDERDQE